MLEDILASSEQLLCFLSDISTRDAKFDLYKRSSEKVKDLYLGTDHNRLGERMSECSERIGFNVVVTNLETGEAKLNLSSARFCRVRQCAVCQSRRVAMWLVRFHKHVPQILADYPNMRFIFLTLTVQNCPIENLRETIIEMNKAWQRLTQRVQFPAEGFVKSIEVTRSSSQAGNAHPHFHCLLAVPSSYFVGRKYLKQEKWAGMWKDCLRVDYDPIVHVRMVKGRKETDDPVRSVMAGVVEVAKYMVKPEDLSADRDWLLELTRQLHKVRAISLGGIFREYLREEEPEDLISESDPTEKSEELLVFDWNDWRKRYVAES